MKHADKHLWHHTPREADNYECQHNPQDPTTSSTGSNGSGSDSETERSLFDELGETIISKRNRIHHQKHKPNRIWMYIRNRSTPYNLFVGFVGFIFFSYAFHRCVSMYMTNRLLVPVPTLNIHRTCDNPNYPVLSSQIQQEQASISSKEFSSSSRRRSLPRICITTLTDSKSKGLFQRLMRWRNYDSVMDLTWSNKAHYASKHGYSLTDHSSLIYTSRPPAWTKVLALQALLNQQTDPDAVDYCDWAVWLDADTVIMNSSIPFESFLPVSNSSQSLLAAIDDRNGGHNSGVLFFRNTAWSRDFLQNWWDMKSFVRPPGLSLSGDNNALKALLAATPDFDLHVLVPSRCQFNSFAFFKPPSHQALWKDELYLQQQRWYKTQGYYHKGDLIAHVAGCDNKARALEVLLKYAQ